MFQKGSSILEDANDLIDMAKQMGLIGAQIEAALPNATKCASWQDIQASHISTDHAPLTLKAFYGGLSLFALGLFSSIVGFWAEKLTQVYQKHFKKAKQNGHIEERFVHIIGGIFWRKREVKPARPRQVRRNRLVGNVQPKKMENSTNGPLANLPAPPPDVAIYKSPFGH